MLLAFRKRANKNLVFFIKNHFRLLLIVAIGIKIFLILIIPEIADAKNAHTLGLIFLKTHTVYKNTSGLNPYPPIFILYYSAIVYLSALYKIPFVYIYKIVPFLADMGILFLLNKILKSKVVTIFYAFNPIAIIVATVFGKEEPMVIFFALVAYLQFNKRKSILLSSFFLGISVWLKTFTIILIPLYFKLLASAKEKIILIVICFLPLVLIMAPHLLSDFQSVNKTYLSYLGAADYGWIAIIKIVSALISGSSINFTPVNSHLPLLLTLSKYLFLIIYSGMMIILLYRKKVNLLGWINLVFLSFYIFYGGIGTNFLYWILPFLALYNFRKTVYYTFFATAAAIFYILSQFYEPVLKHFNLSIFHSPSYINGLYFITAVFFWFYLIKLFTQIWKSPA